MPYDEAIERGDSREMNSIYIWLDPVMDLCLLASVQLSLSRLHPGRLMAGYALLCACTLLFMSFPCSRLLHIPVLLLASAVAAGGRRPGRVLEGAFCMFCAALTAAGLASLPGSHAFLAPPGTILAAVLLRRRRHINHRWDIEVEVELDGTVVSFPALIDTGNRLHEPGSGLPVLIAEASLLYNIQNRMASLPESRLRTLPYGVLGGGGEIKCIKPDAVHIVCPGIGSLAAPQCWLAVFPGKIPGRSRALAPPEFAEAIHNPLSGKNKRNNRTRRFVHHGIFKHPAVHLRYGGTNPQGIGLLHRRQRSPASPVDP